MNEKTKSKIHNIKRLLKPDLNVKDWNEKNFHSLFNPSILRNNKSKYNLKSKNCSSLTKEEFKKFVEKPWKPVVLLGLQDDWETERRWDFRRLERKYGDWKFMCNINCNQSLSPPSIKLKYYLEYIRNKMEDDDEPISIIEPNFRNNKRKCRLAKHYKIPKYFNDNLIDFISNNLRPCTEWLEIGSIRSGIGMAKTRFGLSSWTAVVKGERWYCLLPPNTPTELVFGSFKENRTEITRNAIEWFFRYFPNTINSLWPEEYHPIMGLVKEGQVLFVPAGWWKVGINLEDTIAVTHSFCSLTTFHFVWQHLIETQPVLVVDWYENLKQKRPLISSMAEFTDEWKKPKLLLNSDDDKYTSDISSLTSNWSSSTVNPSEKHSLKSHPLFNIPVSKLQNSKYKKKSVFDLKDDNLVNNYLETIDNSLNQDKTNSVFSDIDKKSFSKNSENIDINSSNKSKCSCGNSPKNHISSAYAPSFELYNSNIKEKNINNNSFDPIKSKILYPLSNETLLVDIKSFLESIEYDCTLFEEQLRQNCTRSHTTIQNI